MKKPKTKKPPRPEAELLNEISAFCRKSGMALSTFGRKTVNDGKFFERVKKGGKVQMETATAIRKYIADNSTGVANV